MSVQNKSVSFTDPALAYARELVESGEYPDVSAAVCGELAKARRLRESETRSLEADITRRIQASTDEWHPTRDVDQVSEETRNRLEALVRSQSEALARTRLLRSGS